MYYLSSLGKRHSRDQSTHKIVRHPTESSPVQQLPTMLKITPAITLFLFATVAMTNANVVEKGSSGKPGLLRNPPRTLKNNDNKGNGGTNKGKNPTSKAQKAAKVRVEIFIYCIIAIT